MSHTTEEPNDGCNSAVVVHGRHSSPRAGGEPLLKQDSVPHVLAALESELAGLSKVASELLRSRNLAVVPAELGAALGSMLPHVRANALSVLAANHQWEALITALQRLTPPMSGS